MKARFLLLSLVSLLAAFPAVAGGVSVKDLPPFYRKWLQEEVVYIISPKEKDVFLQLTTDRERGLFIEAFWKARNPDPAAAENAFKKEHYRRIQYANLWFGRGLASGGWRSDMGRMYIILGEPKQIQKFENEESVYPLIIWFYEGMGEYGLPNAFNVVFFKNYGAGDYILYSPVRDGPQKLMPNYAGDQTDYLKAFASLQNIDPNIAEVSLTLIPNDYFIGMNPSIASDILIGKQIPAAAYEKVKSEYAEKLLKYKDVIEVDYTANYISSDALVQVFRDEAGRAFVHYLIEPSKLTIEQFEGVYRTILNVNGIVSDAKGNTIYQFDRSIPLELNQDQFAKIKDRLVSFEDIFPVVDGDYKLSVLWKNTVSKEFTSVEATLKVPPAGTLTMSSPLLANRVVRNPEFLAKTKPFTAGGIELMASPRNDFAAQDMISIYFQLDGLTDGIKKAGSLEFAITKEEQAFKSFTKALKDYADPGRILEDVPLADFPPAYYTVRVALLDANKTELVSGKASFYITPNKSVPRPWILYAPLPPPGDPYFANALGMQYLRLQDLGKARPLLEDAFRRKPDSVDFALDFCRALFAAKDYEGLKKVALPFYADQKKYEFAQVLGESSQALGDYAQAIVYYKDYLSSFGTNLNVLNAVGECYFRAGDISQALTAWKKSLEINPKQDELKKRVDELQGKVKEKR
jgi:GWxTD domain-containing protein